MIAVVPYRQFYDETDRLGRIIKPKGVYVDYGVDVNTGQNVCLPSEEWYSFIARNCFLHREMNEYILKG